MTAPLPPLSPPPSGPVIERLVAEQNPEAEKTGYVRCRRTNVGSQRAGLLLKQ